MLASTRTLLTQDLLPCVLVYAIVVWLLVRYRRTAADPSRGTNVLLDLRARLLLLGSTIVGGYVVFVVLAGGISLLAGESGSYIRDALLGGAVLAFAIVAPLFAAATAREQRRELRRAESR